MIKSYSAIRRLVEGKYETNYNCSSSIPTNVQPLLDKLLDIETEHLLKNVGVVPKSIEIKVKLEI